ncbi:hypothetical protein OPT61_g6656 [Boeremia exigua]|uniref:Uncharacterized protein n=1 Tax=Boeremia exigua TaxID=749465 RepID=A0ACC2I575_9PLEO|nr:hypothetical protein OPT61_g6656 [Boeremia exigua]
MKLPPFDVILSWPKPNYTNPVTRGDALLIVNTVFIVLVVITVGMRMYTRLVIKRCFGLDDVFTLLALLFTIGLTAIVILANQKYGWDRHLWDIPLNKLVPTLKIAMAAKVVFTCAATFTRLSLHCLFYRLVADTGRQWFRVVIHVNVAYTIAIFISFIFLAIFMCTPVSDYWTIGSPADSCLNEGTSTLVCGIINCVADLATTVTPIPLIIGLHMPRTQRCAIAFLFAMGIIVTVAGIVRTYFIYKSLILNYDNTWYAYPLWIAAAIEIDLGVICASVPVLKPLLTKIPFSLSGTFSGGISLGKKIIGYSFTSTTSRMSSSAAESSRYQTSAANQSTKRALEVIQDAPDLERDQGRSFEMSEWDEERAIISSELLVQTPTRQTQTSQTQDAIISADSSGSPKAGGFQKVWQKMRTRRSESSGSSGDMTITMTSEVELSNEPASAYNSKRNSRCRDVFRQHRAARETKSPTSQQIDWSNV